MIRCLTLAVLLFATGALAAPETRDGFFLQFNIGPATQSWQLDDPSPAFSALSIEGTGAQLDVSIGGHIVDNLAVFGQLSTATAVGPTLTLESGGISASDTGDSDVSASTVGVGAGLQYAFMPLNLYVAASFLSLQLQIEVDGERRGSETGSGFQLRVGKEWWTNEEWSLGVAAHYLTGSIPDEDVPNDWDVRNFGLTFSASFN